MASNQVFEILNKTITAATSITAVSYGDIETFVKGLTIEANFTYGSGGTSAKAYVQTSIDGTNWIDIACFAFTTASARKVCNLRADTPVTTIATPTDGTLSDNTVVDGIIGQKIRTKYVTVGTYGGTTTLVVTAKTNA